MTDSISWRNPKVLRVLAIVFVAGALSGAVTYRLARILTRTQAAAAAPDLREKKAALEYLKSQLNLTPVQTEQVAAIIDDYQRYYGNIQDQVEEVRATGKNRILQVLDADQRGKFEKFAGSLK